MHVSPSTIATAFSAVAAAVSLVTALVASPLIVSKIRLAAERDEARQWADRLQGRLAAQSADLASLIGLGDEVRAMRGEMLETRKTLVVAFRHIAALIVHIRRRGGAATMPELPPEISDDVLAELRAHDLDHDAAVQGAAGVLTVPGGAS